MITADIAIEAISQRIRELENVVNSKNFKTWRKTIIQTLKRIVPNNNIIIAHLEDIRSYSTITQIDSTTEAKNEAIQILYSFIEDIQTFGIEKIQEIGNDKTNLNFNINQHNNQNQSTSISINIDFIIDVLKGELRNSEIEEVKEILESDEEPKTKKKKFIEKIKSFGSDVASNILANILTNPQVYGQIGNML